MPDKGESHTPVVESPAPLALTEHKQTGRHMPVDPAVLVLPELCDYGFPARDWHELRVKHGGACSSIYYRNNRLVPVGWKTDLFPFKPNIRDIVSTASTSRPPPGVRLPNLSIEIVKWPDRAQGFEVRPKRRVVERTLGWLNRCRRLAEDFENLNRNAMVFPRNCSPYPGAGFPELPG